VDKLTKVIRTIYQEFAQFSRYIMGLPLYRYQLVPMEAIRDSVLNRSGLEFLLVFPRQSGKNEAVAQLLVFLLNLLQRSGGNIVYGATGDGLGRGITRLEDRLDNPLNAGHWKKSVRPASRILGNAAVVFLSTHPSALARGETAHWLLVIDEMQDQASSHFEAVFEPMRAANNATAVYIGTVKSSTDALWIKKRELEALQGQDHIQRVFIVSAEEVTAENSAYGEFLAKKVAKLGRSHPIVASEYFNEPLDNQGRLFDRRRLALMQGSHERNTEPRQISGPVVATLDVGGQDEAATDLLANLANPGRDFTVAHVFEMRQSEHGDSLPAYKALDIFVDQGSRHFQSVPGLPSLVERLLAWYRHWGVIHLVADESGVGGGLVDWMASKMGPTWVTGYNFAGRQGKAALGSRFLSVVETGRFQYWSGEADQPLSDDWWFFNQARYCQYYLPAEGQFDRDLRWGVPDSYKIDSPEGRVLLHDDRLISAALVAVFDDLIKKGAVRLGRAVSAIIQPIDPLDQRELEY
jgi:hypothetical protein